MVVKSLLRSQIHTVEVVESMRGETSTCAMAMGGVAGYSMVGLSISLRIGLWLLR